MYREIFLEFLENKKAKGETSAQVEYALHNRAASFSRASLLLACVDSWGGEIQKALPWAYAIECIHCASLIQDDLPCMDNEQYRRGRLALHKQYSESDSILTSDALFGLAYLSIANSEYTPVQKVRAMEVFSNAILNLVEGQSLELHGKNDSLEALETIHANKTAALFKLIAQFSEIISNTSEYTLFESIGVLYQICDDFKDKDGIFVYKGTPELNLLIDKHINIVKSGAKLYQNNYIQKMINKILENIYNLTSE